MANTYNLGANSWWPPDQAAAEEFYAYSQEIDEARSLEQFDRVVGACKAHLRDPSAGPTLNEQIKAKIRNKEPGSYVRLGDADGNALYARSGKYRALADYCVKKISRIYFGNDDLMKDHIGFFTDSVIEAVEEADVVGGPVRPTVSRSFHTPAPDLDVRGMCGMRGVYNYFGGGDYDLSRLANAAWASTWYSRSLLPYYFDFLKDQPSARFITCYEELGPLVQQRANIGEVETHLVPMQASIAFQTKKVAHMKKDIGHYPDVFPRIMEAIRPPYDGCVYIIAAGILSKAYCTQVKRRGGIAIDIGSVADIWMNFQSRPNAKDDLVAKYALKS